jgi:hypothetical protein
MVRPNAQPVMPGLVPGIHIFLRFAEVKAWMAGSADKCT